MSEREKTPSPVAPRHVRDPHPPKTNGHASHHSSLIADDAPTTSSHTTPRIEDLEPTVLAYLRQVEGLHLVGCVLFGVDKREKRAYVFNVLKEDTPPAAAIDPRFAALTRLAGHLEHELETNLSATVAIVRSSGLGKLTESCHRRGIDLVPISLKSQPEGPAEP